MINSTGIKIIRESKEPEHLFYSDSFFILFLFYNLPSGKNDNDNGKDRIGANNQKRAGR